MSNRISAILDDLEVELAALVSAGDIRAVTRGVIQPLTAAAVPAVGLAISRLARFDKRGWTAEVLIQLAIDSGAEAAEERTIDAVAAVDAKILAFADSGRAGGNIDGPTWDTWFVPTNEGRLTRVGAIGSMRIVIDGQLT
jgi:hypothetical protein